MITIIFEDDIDFYFARERVTEKLAQASTFLPAGVDALPGSRRHGAGADLLVHGGTERRTTRSIRHGCGRSTSSTSLRNSTRRAGVADVAIVGGTAAGISDRRATRRLCGPTASRWANCIAAVGQSNMPAGGGVDPEEQRRIHRPRRRLDSRTSEDIENTVIKEVDGTPIYVKNVATVQLGTQFRRSVFEKDGNEVAGGVGADAARREPAGRHRARQGEDPGASAGLAARACTSCRPTTARG